MKGKGEGESEGEVDGADGVREYTNSLLEFCDSACVDGGERGKKKEMIGGWEGGREEGREGGREGGRETSGKYIISHC